MKSLASLQQRLGFTPNEVKVVLFLSVTFLAGFGIRWYDALVQKQNIPRFDYSNIDSEFTARSNTLVSPGPTTTTPVPSVPRQKPALKASSINLNTATSAQLIQLPGIGASYAERIIAYRSEHGNFKDIDELANVKGIGKKRLEQIRPFVTVTEKSDARSQKSEKAE
jgi:comEA protein